MPRFCESVIEIFQEEHGINFDLSCSDLDDLEQIPNNNPILNNQSQEEEPEGDGPTIVHYEAPDQQRHSSRSSGRQAGTYIPAQQSQAHPDAYTAFPLNYNYQSDFRKDKGEEGPRKSDWKNESLNSSLKFVENERNSEQKKHSMSSHSAQGQPRWEIERG